MEEQQNPRHNNELLGTKDVLAECKADLDEDADEIDFAERAGMTDEEFKDAFGEGDN